MTEGLVLAGQAGVDFQSLSNPLEAFLQSAVDSIHTRRAYKRHIQNTFKMLAVEYVQEMTPNHLIYYRAVLLDDGRGSATHAQALSSLRSFLLWCSDLGGLPFPSRIVERLLRVPSAEVLTPYATLTRGEVDRLVAAADNPRDKALVLVMLGGGLRVSEVQNLDCSDVIEMDGEPVLWVRQGKGNKDRFVPVNDEVLEAIHDYLDCQDRRVGGSEPLFLAEDRAAGKRDSARLSSFGIRYVLGEAVRTAGIARRVTPHALRHTFGMDYQRASCDLNKTAKVMGHKTLRPTLRYTDHLQLAELRVNLPKWLKKSWENV